MNELRQAAKAKGINSLGKTKIELEQLLETPEVKAVLDIQPSKEQKQEAKEARMEGRARRGGAILGKGEAKLDRPEYVRKGFKRHWFKDEGGRLNAAYANDWDYVLDEKTKEKKTYTSGTNKDGRVRVLYLMEKRMDWYKEDQLKKHEQDRKNHKLLTEGKLTGSQYGADAANASNNVPMYSPQGGIQINSVIKQ